MYTHVHVHVAAGGMCICIHVHLYQISVCNALFLFHSSARGYSIPRGQEERGVSSLCSVQWELPVGHILCAGFGGSG